MLTLEMENLSENYPIIDLVYHLFISTFSDFYLLLILLTFHYASMHL
jgi:hypothetical protein